MIRAAEIGSSFSKVANNYDRYADIQNSLSEELLDKLLREGKNYEAILDIGCGTGSLLKMLEKSFPESVIAGFDISREMAMIARRRNLNSFVADASILPFKNETFDLVLSSAVYQWVFNLGEAFKETERVLKKDGYFMFSCFGSRTLQELRSCFGIKENILPNADSVSRYLEMAGFAIIDIYVNMRNKYFDNLIDLLSWLKFIGANRINSEKSLVTPRRLAEANHFYCANYGASGKVYASFEVIWARVRKNV